MTSIATGFEAAWAQKWAHSLASSTATRSIEMMKVAPLANISK
jgi:hypothetical protein